MRALPLVIVTLAGLPTGAHALGLTAEGEAPLLGPVTLHAGETGLAIDGPVAVRVPLDAPPALDLRVALPSSEARAESAGRDEARESPGAVEAAAPTLGAIAAALAFGKLGLWRVAAGFAIALYSRIAPSEILNQAHRERIVNEIRTTPGISIHELRERLGLGWGTTTYHLDRLTRAGLVTTERVGASRRLFLPGLTPAGDRAAQGLLQAEGARRLAEFVRAHPGATQRDLCEALAMNASAASKNLSKLEAAGLIRREREGRVARLFPASPLLAGGPSGPASAAPA